MLQFTEIEHLSPNEFSKCRARERVILDPALLSSRGDGSQEYPILCRWQKPPNDLFQNHSQNNLFLKLLLGLCFWVLCPNEEPESLSSSAIGTPCKPHEYSSSSSSLLELLISVLELGVWATRVPEQPSMHGKGGGTQRSILQVGPHP